MTAVSDVLREAAWPVLVEQLGREVTWKDPDQGESTITALVGAERADERADEDGRRWSTSRTMTVDPQLLPAIHPQAIAVIDGIEYAVEGVEAISPHAVRIRLVGGERIEAVRPRWRST
jgi:hypothetical protein